MSLKIDELIANKIHIAVDEDVGKNQSGSLIIGNKSGINIGIDGNEIMARNNSSVSELYLNNEGGAIFHGGNIYPTGNNSINLGDNNHKYANVYATTFRGNLDGTATGLKYSPADRPTSANTAVGLKGDQTLRAFMATSSMIEAKPPNGDGVVIQTEWDWAGWPSQLAISNGDTHLAIRGTSDATTWGDWKTVLDTGNYQNTLNNVYVKKSGDVMSGGLLFAHSTNNAPTTGTPTALSYGRLQAYGTLSINGNTDNNGTEYVNITAGHGMSDSTSDGLSVGPSSVGIFGRDDSYKLYINGKTRVIGGQLTADQVSVSGTSDSNTALNALYWSGGLEIRESRRVSEKQSAFQYAPRIGFYWGGRTAGSLSYHSDGKFYLKKQDGSNRATLDADISGSADYVGNVSIGNIFYNRGWWNSGDSHSLNDAGYGSTFTYNSHGAPTSWGMTETFAVNDNYKAQLHITGYSNHMYYRSRSADRGGWTNWCTVMDSEKIHWGRFALNFATGNGAGSWTRVAVSGMKASDVIVGWRTRNGESLGRDFDPIGMVYYDGGYLYACASSNNYFGRTCNVDVIWITT